MHGFLSRNTRKVVGVLTALSLAFNTLLPAQNVLSTIGNDLPQAIAAESFDLRALVIGTTYNWTGGNICQGNNGCYAEGDDIPLRIEGNDLVVGQNYEVQIELAYTDGVVFGYDTLHATSPVLAHSGADNVNVSLVGTSTCGSDTCQVFSVTFDATAEDAFVYVDATLGDEAADWNGATLHTRMVLGGDATIPINPAALEVLPSLTMTKVVDSGNALPSEWCFNVSPAIGGQSQFCITGDGDGVDTVTLDSVPEGSYTVTEVGPDGYAFASGLGTNCTFAGDVATASVVPGSPNSVQNATCTFHNAQSLGSLTVTKDVVGPDGVSAYDDTVGVFTMDFNGESVDLADGESHTFTSVPVGDYTLIESAMSDGYELVSYSVDSNADSSDGAQVSVVTGETTTVTVTNRIVGGSITVVKEVLDQLGNPTDDDMSFDIELDSSSAGSVAEGSNLVISDLLPGDYTIEEVNLPAGYDFVSYSVDNNADSSDGAQITVVNNENATVTVVNQQQLSQLDIEKVDSVDPVAAGGSTTYTILVTNSGVHTLHDVVVTDPVPAEFVIASATPTAGSCSVNTVDNSISCDLGDIPGGEWVSIDVVTDVSADTEAGDYLNTATVVATEYPDGVEADETTTVIEDFTLTIEKDDSVDPVTAGDTFTYSIVVSNEGPSNADEVVVTDSVPSVFDVLSLAVTGEYDSCGFVDQDVTCDLGTLDADEEVTIEVTVSVDPSTEAGPYDNTAYISSEGENEGSSTETTTVVEEASLTVEKVDDVDPSVVAGGSFTYTITVSNDGPSDADNVVLTDPIPDGFTVTNIDQGSCSVTLGVVECNIGTLDVDEEFVVNITVDVDSDTESGDYVNTATATSDEDEAEDSETTTVVEETDLDIEKVADGSVYTAGVDNVTYTVTVSNGGPSDADNVVITDALPDVFEFVSAVDCTYDDIEHEVTCDVGDLPVGDEASFDIVVSVPSTVDAGTYNNVAVASSDDQNDVEDDEDVDVVEDVELVVEKEVDNSDVIAGGATLVYTITVTNNGASDADNVVVTDQLPAEFTYISIDDGTCSYDDVSHEVSCEVDHLAPGGELVYEITVSVGADVEPGIYNNYVVAVSDEDQDDDDVDVEVDEVSDIQVDKYDNYDQGETAVAGESDVDYTIEVTNGGPSDTENVVVVDTLPAEFEFVSLSTNDNTVTCEYVDASHSIECTKDSLLVDESFEIYVTVSVGAEADPGEHTNYVEVTSDGGEDSDEEITEVEEVVDLSVDKTHVEDGPFVAGQDSVTYEITTVNNGPSDAENLTLYDDVPVELTVVSVDNSECEIVEDTINGGYDVACSLGSLGAGESWVVTYTVSIDEDIDEGDYNNYVVVESDEDEADDEDDIYVVEESEIIVEKVDSQDEVSLGEEFEYIFTVTNNGPSEADDLQLYDEVPDGITILGVSDGDYDCKYIDTQISCLLGDLAVGESVEIVLTVVVNDDAQPGTVTNVVVVTDENNEEHTDEEDTTVLEEAVLEIEKTNNQLGNVLSAGDSVVYMLEVSVVNAPMNDIVVSDLIPEGLDYVPGSSGFTIASGSGSVTPAVYSNGYGEWMIDRMEVGDSIVLYYTATVQDAVTPGIFPDLAWGAGVSDGSVDIAAISPPGGLGHIAGVANFVATQVVVDEDVVEETGVVLGAVDVQLPQTGLASVFTLFGLVMSIIGGVFVFLNGRKPTFKPAVGLMTVALFSAALVGSAHAASGHITFGAPESPSNLTEFKIPYTAAMAGDFTVNCFVKAPGSSAYTIFDTDSGLSNYASGSCTVASGVITNDGDYSFYAQILGADSSETNSTAVTYQYDGASPGAANSVETEVLGTCSARISVDVPSDSDIDGIQIFRSTQQSFTANADTLIHEESVSAGESYEHVDEPSNCSSDYYYAVRFTDTSGNVSDITAEVIENIVVIEQPEANTDTGAVAPVAPPVDGNGDILGETETEQDTEDGSDDSDEADDEEDGEVLGEEDENGENDEDEDENSDDNEEDDDDDSSSTDVNWRLVGGVGLLAAVVVYLLYRRNVSR